MRGTWTLVLAVTFGAAGCGGGDGTGDDGDDGDDVGDDAGDDSGDDGGDDTPMIDRLHTTTVTTPAGVLAGGSNWRIWGTGDLRVAPVFTVPLAGCDTLVGYTTGPAPGTARVSRITDGALVETYDLGPYVLRGLAAEPDGHFAALLWDTGPDPASLHVQRFTATGAPDWSTSLDDDLAMPTDFGIGESRLEYGDGRYGAYFHVHGISGFANGHEGDALHWLDAPTGAHSLGWDWGCSHSMSELLRYDGGAGEFLSACVTDCFPGTSGDFVANSIGGIYLDRQRKVLDVDGGCNGSVAGELGGMAPADGGWALVFNAHQTPATPGQSSYNSSSMNQDIGFVAIGADQTPGAVTWLTTTGANEANASIAAWRPSAAAAARYVVGWSEGPARKLAVVDGAGAFLEEPVDAPAEAAWGERDDPFRTRPGGEVVWAAFDAAGSTTLRLSAIGGESSCAP